MRYSQISKRSAGLRLAILLFVQDATWEPTFDDDDAWDLHRWARAAVEEPADELQQLTALWCAVRAALLTELKEPRILETLELALAGVGVRATEVNHGRS